jgi:uncharacterized membrane protein YagU involved in acid resistance
MRMRQRKHRGRELALDAAKGIVAGAVATWVMGKATAYLYEHESKTARQAEDEARGGKTAYGVAAEKGASVVGADLSEKARKKAGMAIHWGLGVGAGALYGALRGRLPGAELGNGLAFGTAFWLLVDEGANTALGLTPGPTAFPWQTHARGLAGHLVFGVAADATLRALDGVA